MIGIIGCEESQTVTNEFRARGHTFFSNDIKPASGGGNDYHMQMCVIEAINSRPYWDFIGLHPVCTKMTLSGNRHYAPGKPKHHQRIEAVEWTIALWELAIRKSKRVYMENPMGALNADPRLPKPQIINPYYFGDEARKQTCLWLHGLPRLVHIKQDDLFSEKTHVAQGEDYRWICSKTGKTKRQPLWYAQAKGFGGKQKNKDFSEARSKTFPGIARAMAQQWG